MHLPTPADKRELYRRVESQAVALLGQGHAEVALDDVARMACLATVLKWTLPDLTFAGFYRLAAPDLLLIGPYQGEVLACPTIPLNRGVCGTAAARAETVIVPDVSRFPGYLACDAETRSEIVVPVICSGRLTAVLDLDSHRLAAFDEVDRECLERLVQASFP